MVGMVIATSDKDKKDRLLARLGSAQPPGHAERMMSAARTGNRDLARSLLAQLGVDVSGARSTADMVVDHLRLLAMRAELKRLAYQLSATPPDNTGASLARHLEDMVEQLRATYNLASEPSGETGAG